MIPLHTKKQARKAPNMYRPLINGNLDDPDCVGPIAPIAGDDIGERVGGVGPSPLLQRSFSQQDLQTTVPSVSGSVHSVSGHLPSGTQLRLKVVTEPSSRTVLTMMQRFSLELQLTTVSFPSPEELNAHSWRASDVSSLTQL